MNGLPHADWRDGGDLGWAVLAGGVLGRGASRLGARCRAGGGVLARGGAEAAVSVLEEEVDE